MPGVFIHPGFGQRLVEPPPDSVLRVGPRPPKRGELATVEPVATDLESDTVPEAQKPPTQKDVMEPNTQDRDMGATGDEGCQALAIWRCWLRLHPSGMLR